MATDSIYKAYSIRGIWGQDIDEVLANELGRAFASYIRPKRVGVGRDGRLSSPVFAAAVITGLRQSGVNVVDLGILPVDAFYFAIEHYKLDGGSMITASHNPSEWNGIKFTRTHADPLVGEENIAIGKIIEQKEFTLVSDVAGTLESLDVMSEFIKLVATGSSFTGSRPLKIVVDPGNGAVGLTLPRLLEQLPFEWHGINMELDGHFPGRGPDPAKSSALEELGQAVVRHGADAGFAFDADGDRVFVVDDRGQVLKAGLPIVFLARRFLQRQPGASIVYNLICTHVVPEEIQKSGGVPIRAGVGNINLFPAMRKHQAPFSGETAGHFRFAEYNFLDSAIIAMVVILDYLSHQPSAISSLVKEVDRYAWDAVNERVANTEPAIQKLREHFQAGQSDEMDGLTIEYPTWWFNVRASNTEPLLRLTVEANTKDEMVQRREELLKLIRGE